MLGLELIEDFDNFILKTSIFIDASFIREGKFEVLLDMYDYGSLYTLLFFLLLLLLVLILLVRLSSINDDDFLFLTLFIYLLLLSY